MIPEQLVPALMILTERIEKLESLVTILARRQVWAYSAFNNKKSFEDEVLWDATDLRPPNPESNLKRTR